ncbi:hypothetical protein [Pseudoalteromonas sp. FUC4]|nr:hypothetical protein [Pseudoalteromonas sp. FUC4]
MNTSTTIFQSIKQYAVALGSVDLSRLNLQQSVWYLGKTEPM